MFLFYPNDKHERSQLIQVIFLLIIFISLLGGIQNFADQFP